VTRHKNFCKNEKKAYQHLGFSFAYSLGLEGRIFPDQKNLVDVPSRSIRLGTEYLTAVSSAATL
jgi:hypothetical protein